MGDDPKPVKNKIKKQGKKNSIIYELRIVSEKNILGDEDVLKVKLYCTTVTQISSKAEWIKMSREDFLNKFIN